MSEQLKVGADGQVYRLQPNTAEDPEDDYGSYVLVTPAELLAAAQHFLSDDLIVGALETAAVNARAA